MILPWREICITKILFHVVLCYLFNQQCQFLVIQRRFFSLLRRRNDWVPSIIDIITKQKTLFPIFSYEWLKFICLIWFRNFLNEWFRFDIVAEFKRNSIAYCLPNKEMKNKLKWWLNWVKLRVSIQNVLNWLHVHFSWRWTVFMWKFFLLWRKKLASHSWQWNGLSRMCFDRICSCKWSFLKHLNSHK